MQTVFPKCPVCGSGSGYEYSGITGKYAKCYSCQAKWKMNLVNQQLSNLILHELPKNGVALHRVARTGMPLFASLGLPFEVDFWLKLNLEKNIDWAYLSRNVDSALLSCVVTEKNETILNAWKGSSIMRVIKTVQGNSVVSQEMQSGALLLTSRRLIWLNVRQTGVWKPIISYQVSYEILLENIKGISGETGDSGNWQLPKNVSIVDNQSEKNLNLQFAFLELIKPTMDTAIRIRRDEIEAEKKKEKVHIMLDFSFLKTIMEKGGLVMQVLKCPECGASAEFPKSGNATQCSHCGKTIYAQDVFEKVKNLI